MQQRIEKAYKLRTLLEKAAQSLSDKESSEASCFFPRLKGDGSLIASGTKINWNGQVKRAANALWDRPENNPDKAPDLWEDIDYREGYRIIPEVITAGLAFEQNELGWWNDVLYRSTIANNVWTPDAYPEGWALVE